MKRYLICIIICITLCACALTLAACNQESTEAPLAPMSEVRLEKDHILVWDAVPQAQLYMLRVRYDDFNGFEVPVKDTTYSLKLFEAGTYRLSVCPVFANSKGAYSPELIYELSNDVVVTPTDEGNVILYGAGTADNPLRIYTKEDLVSLVNGEPTLELDEIYYRLMDDIDLEGTEWKSIGSYSSPFRGNFDGNGKTIRHLTQTVLNGDSVKSNGLFGMLSSATVINLTLEDASITIGVVTPKFHVGVLTGYSSNTVVENCRVTGSIHINSPQSTQQPGYAGMFVGYSNGTNFRYCTADGDIDITCALAFGGGICAICTNDNLDNFDNCLSTVSVKASGTGISGGKPQSMAYASGIAYIVDVSGVSNCVWRGSAKAYVLTGTDLSAGPVAEGMFTCYRKTSTFASVDKTSYTYSELLEDCYFDVDTIDYDKDVYDPNKYPSTELWLAGLADRYCVGGATTQMRTSTVGAVHAATKTQASFYPGLDFDTHWEMGEDGPVLRDHTNRWYEVKFVVGEEVVSTIHVLGGQSAPTITYVGEENHAVQWEYDFAPIMADTVIYAKTE